MASPSMESFCCMSSKSNHSIEWILDIPLVPYDIVCTISALIGLFGAIYQLLPYQEEERISRRHITSITSQRNIIWWLALADALATAGIIARSITWLAHKAQYHPESKNEIVFCAIVSTWIHFFYASTYFWTIFYAVDVYLATREIICKPWKYHATVWSFSTLVTSVSLVTLYMPDFKCHDKGMHVLINYIFTYIPVVVAMVVNPVLYILASKEVKILLTSLHGQFSDHERRLLSAMREKFIFIVGVFYCCWTTNIINGLVLWNTWPKIPKNLTVGMMFMIAVLNPLQAFLNSLVYRGWSFCGKIVCNICCHTSLMAVLPSEASLIRPVLEDESNILNSTE